MKVKNNAGRVAHHDWKVLQADYDAGLSTRDLMLKHGVSKGDIQSGVNRGNLRIRDKSAAMKNLHEMGGGPKSYSNNTKLRIASSARKNILARYDAGWMPKAGRCKKIAHMSPIAGVVILDGTWELNVAMWLDSMKYVWLRNTKRFPYVNLKGTTSYYTPDFWVEDLGGYLEIKGYETELDRCRWSQFTEPLTIWKRSDLVERSILAR